MSKTILQISFPDVFQSPSNAFRAGLPHFPPQKPLAVPASPDLFQGAHARLPRFLPAEPKKLPLP
ncbi:hypothetical protein MH928_06245 [Flavobacterium sp. WW92]|uniref:hypothetical protein n=1 Tax=unclassified Flavobacterium TaxID=196869 RepID=UPI00222579E9|nr:MULTISPECIES: hypothetical protein [unclassified Flavobacterium]WDO14297.1 hypothetical protein MH928_06245 [Flavobacterium sp. WW92]